MKTAVSVPTELFNQAEELARQLGMTRSELYTVAVSSLISSYRDRKITDCLNEIYERDPAKLDRGLQILQASVVEDEGW